MTSNLILIHRCVTIYLKLKYIAIKMAQSTSVSAASPKGPLGSVIPEGVNDTMVDQGIPIPPTHQPYEDIKEVIANTVEIF